MTDRRALADMLVDIADGVLALRVPDGLRATSLEVELPVEIELRTVDGAPEFRCELPRFVTRTSFDRAPDRLLVRFAEGAPEGGTP